jgi:hypothetical protein
MWDHSENMASKVNTIVMKDAKRGWVENTGSSVNAKVTPKI